MLKIINALLLPLATWRVTHLLVYEDGPFDCIAKLRTLAGVRYDQHNMPYGNNVLAQMLSCIWCLSIWVGLFYAVMLLYAPENVMAILALPFAASALAIFIDNCVAKD
jgi:hypothetical protein